jgi:ADP-ribose pyrophosphatase YjhB (NUDIX family)
VHAVPFTRTGKVVLVKLSYATGWRVPGGGIKRGEDLSEAAVRELTEEIGLIRFESLIRLDDPEEAQPGTGALFVLMGIDYHPRRSIEIEAVREFDPELLPQDISTPARRWISRALTHRALS